MPDSKILLPCIPLPLNPEELDEIVSKSKDFALMHGIAMRSKLNFNSDSLQVSNFTWFIVGDFQGCLKIELVMTTYSDFYKFQPNPE